MKAAPPAPKIGGKPAPPAKPSAPEAAPAPKK